MKKSKKYVYCVMILKLKTYQFMAQFIYNTKEKAEIMKKSAEKVFFDCDVKIERYEVG